jgi:adenylosuccinate synthase
MLAWDGYDGEIIRLGVTRAYQIRHGAGPMVTHDPAMSEALLPGSNKDENRWQGKVRVGPLDFVALRYSVDVCGGPSHFDGIAVTWFDQIVKNGQWKVCTAYQHPISSDRFDKSGRTISLCHGEDEEQLARQSKLGRELQSCHPILRKHDVSLLDQKETIALCQRVFQDELQVNVRMISFGPTEREKVCL